MAISFSFKKHYLLSLYEELNLKNISKFSYKFHIKVKILTITTILTQLVNIYLPGYLLIIIYLKENDYNLNNS